LKLKIQLSRLILSFHAPLLRQLWDHGKREIHTKNVLIHLALQRITSMFPTMFDNNLINCTFTIVLNLLYGVERKP
jgi:hypothetical protein